MQCMETTLGVFKKNQMLIVSYNSSVHNYIIRYTLWRKIYNKVYFSAKNMWWGILFWDFKYMIRVGVPRCQPLTRTRIYIEWPPTPPSRARTPTPIRQIKAIWAVASQKTVKYIVGIFLTRFARRFTFIT